jgi:hypothetical protein
MFLARRGLSTEKHVCGRYGLESWFADKLPWHMLSNVTGAPSYMTHYLKILNFFKELSSTCFGLYGHHHVLRLLWCGNCCPSFYVISYTSLHTYLCVTPWWAAVCVCYLYVTIWHMLVVIPLFLLQNWRNSMCRAIPENSTIPHVA